METQVKPCCVRLVRLTETMPKTASNKLGKTKPNPKKGLQCPVCPQTWSKPPPHLEAHLRGHTNERPFACGVCNRKFKTQSGVKRHLKFHSGQRPYHCLWCDKCFETRDHLMQHLRTHTNEKPYFCEKCPTCFSTTSDLARHRFVNHEFGSGKRCGICSKLFYNSSELRKHSRVHTSEKPFSCLVCGNLFAHKLSLTYHSRIHAGIKPFSCNKCPSQFRTSSSLKRHIRGVHSSARPYKCGICGNTYARKDSRDIHTNSHLNEKPYRCEKCGKRFKSFGGIRYHKKSYHDKIKDFKCSKCPSSFADRQNLNAHSLRMHCSPSERPFHCLFCAKTYCQQERLHDHVRKHLSEQPYFCNTCDFSSGYRSSLKTHIFGAHSIP